VGAGGFTTTRHSLLMYTPAIDDTRIGRRPAENRMIIRPQRPLGVFVAATCVLTMWHAVGPHGRVSAQDATLSEVLARAGAYVEAFNRDLASIVAEEHYSQTFRSRRTKRKSDGIAFAERHLQSDLMLVKPEASADWMQFRDVYEVDGVPVRDRAERLTKIFSDPSASSEVLIDRIQKESARHNIGDIERDLNTPVFALQFLAPNNQAQFKFRLTNERKPGAARQAEGETAAFRVSSEVWVVEYEETGRPSIVRSLDNKDVPTKGKFWVEPQTGSVLMSELVVRDQRRVGTIVVSYQSEPLLGLLVPIEMRERYEELKSASLIEGNATYGRFRQVKTESGESARAPVSGPAEGAK
jgi:hypothetical protein